MQWHDVPHHTQPDLASAGGGCDSVNVGRGHPALIGSEMMLDAKTVVEAEFVSQLQLTPQLLVALCRCHASILPYMGEMRKVHNDIVSLL